MGTTCKKVHLIVGEGYKIGKLYIYNTKTHKMHIRGCCWLTKDVSESVFEQYQYKQFSFEEEAEAYIGQCLCPYLCKLCKKKREEIVRREMMNRK